MIVMASEGEEKWKNYNSYRSDRKIGVVERERLQ